MCKPWNKAQKLPNHDAAKLWAAKLQGLRKSSKKVILKSTSIENALKSIRCSVPIASTSKHQTLFQVFRLPFLHLALASLHFVTTLVSKKFNCIFLKAPNMLQCIFCRFLLRHKNSYHRTRFCKYRLWEKEKKLSYIGLDGFNMRVWLGFLCLHVGWFRLCIFFIASEEQKRKTLFRVCIMPSCPNANKTM